MQSKRIVLVRTRKQLSQLTSGCCKSVVVCKLAFVSANRAPERKNGGPRCGRSRGRSHSPVAVEVKSLLYLRSCGLRAVELMVVRYDFLHPSCTRPQASFVGKTPKRVSNDIFDRKAFLAVYCSDGVGSAKSSKSGSEKLDKW